MTPSGTHPVRAARVAWMVCLLVAVMLTPAGVTATAAGVSGVPRDARTLRVGPERPLGTPSEAAAVARDGERVLIDAGTYAGDVATWTADDLTIEGVGGLVRLPARGQSAQGKATWVVAGDRVVVRRVAFSGVRVPDRNGAGIRAEGSGLRVVRSRFVDNENGILAGDVPDSRITVTDSVFRRNGHGDGQSHHVYVGEVASLLVRGSLLVGSRGGHAVKSRAHRTTLVANRLLDGDARSSYLVDLPDGGDTLLSGNVLRQGPRAVNRTLVSYAAESQDRPVQRLRMVANTLVNDQATGTFVRAVGAPRVWLRNLLVVGAGETTNAGSATVSARGIVRLGAPRGFPGPRCG